MGFKNRREAGQKLAVALAGYENEQAVVLALPRGGVPVAAEIAAALWLPSISFWCARSGCHNNGNWPWAPWSTVAGRSLFATTTSLRSPA
jgi:hypothetical protein